VKHANTRWIWIFAWSFVLALVLSCHFFLQPVRPWPDQGTTLNAAINVFHGRGLVTSVATDDLATQHYQWLSYFPPGYPLIVALLLKFGFGIHQAVQTVNLAAMFIGLAGWTFLANHLIRSTAYQFLFANLLVLACSGIVPRGGTVDYILWAGTGWWLVGLVFSQQKFDSYKIYLYALGLGALASAMILVRWAAVVMIPAGFLSLLCFGSRKHFIRTFIPAVAYVALPLVTYLAIGAINTFFGASENYLAYIKPDWQWSFLLTAYPLECLTTIPLGIEPVIQRFLRAAHQDSNAYPIGLVAHLLIVISFLSFPILVIRRGGFRIDFRNKIAFWIPFAALAASSIAFFSYMSVRYNWHGIDWSYLDEPRYYRPLWPVAALFWISLFECLSSRRLRIGFGAILSVCIIYLFQADLRNEWDLLTSPQEELEAVHEIVSRARASASPQIVFTTDPSDFQILDSPNIFARPMKPFDSPNTIHSSSGVDIWLVNNIHEQLPWVSDPHAREKQFAALRDQFGARKVWSSSAGNHEIWHSRIDP